MKPLVIRTVNLLLLLMLMAGIASALTTVTDIIRNGAGAPVSGTMFITPNSQFTGATGQQVYQVPIVASIGADGVFTVDLVPNDTATPTGSSYTVNYTLDGPPGFAGQTPVETWVVPTSATPVGLAIVRTSPAPTPGSSLGFTFITSGTNIQATMIVGTGASMSVTGSGTIAATTAAALASNPTDCASNLFANAIAANGNLTCAAPFTLTTTGSSGAATFIGGTLNIPQYSGGGGAFSAITSGTNTTAAMVVGTGASIAPTGSGAITATIAPAGTLTGATLASGVLASSLTSVGILTGGATGAGFTIALTTSTVTGTLAAARGGTGVSNTATLTLGSSNQNWATLGTGIVKNTTTTGALSAAVAADVYGLWSGSCSSSTYLRGDGSCQTPSGSGTVTVVSSGSLTSTALVTGGGSATLQTPSATSTLDSSGNMSLAGTLHTGGASDGCASGTAGCEGFSQGTAPSGSMTTGIQEYAPTSVTSYNRVKPGTVGTSGFNRISVSSTTATESFGPLVASDIPAVALTAGTSITLSNNARFFECTSTCTITAPVPSAGVQYCVRNANNVSTVITFAAIGSSARYENTASTAYGTAGTGTLISGGAVGDKICIVGLDSTHYDVFSYAGTWTAS